MVIIHSMFISETHPQTVRGVSACGQVYLTENNSKSIPAEWSWVLGDVTCSECLREIYFAEDVRS